MSNIVKKKEKLKLRIDSLESELKNSLHKKAVGVAINVSDYTTKILKLKKEFNELK